MLACVYDLYEIFHWQQIWEYFCLHRAYNQKKAHSTKTDFYKQNIYF